MKQALTIATIDLQTLVMLCLKRQMLNSTRTYTVTLEHHGCRIEAAEYNTVTRRRFKYTQLLSWMAMAVDLTPGYITHMLDAMDAALEKSKHAA